MTTSSRRSQLRLAPIVASTYAVLACVLTWPLALHLRTHLPGPIGGDTGVYVWNLWIFAHELLDHGRLPFSTAHVFAYTNGTDFSLHNYSPAADLLAVPLVRTVGVVAAFNSVLLVMMTANGLGMYLLARQIGLRRLYAWIAGAVFLASPVITSRATAHLSLVSAAPLPLFAASLLRTLDGHRRRDAWITGALVAVATYCDAYYGVYCVLIGLVLVAWHCGHVVCRGPIGWPRIVRSLDVASVAFVAFIVWHLTGHDVIAIGPWHVATHTLYNPLLAFLVLVSVRVWLTWRPQWRIRTAGIAWRPLFRLGAWSIAICLSVLTPLIVGVALRYAQGRLPDTQVYWRSSPRGVDLLAYFLPNPSHPWLGTFVQSWFRPPGADPYPELVAAFPLVAWAVIAIAFRRRILSRGWLAFSAVFVLLSLGPFVHLGLLNTQVIGPWALLRYAPVVGMARSPSRLAIVAAMGLTLLFARAAQSLLTDSTRRARAVALAAGVVLAIELNDAPLPLYAANVPDIYRLVAAAGEEDGRMLDLPTGIRDGTSSIGDFSAASLFYQTRHRRPLIGGYLSRVSEWRKQEDRRDPILRALFALSAREGPLPTSWLEEAIASRARFLARACIRYVVLDKHRSSEELRSFAVQVLRLTPLVSDPDYELLVPQDTPACEAADIHSVPSWREIVARRFGRGVTGRSSTRPKGDVLTGMPVYTP